MALRLAGFSSRIVNNSCWKNAAAGVGSRAASTGLSYEQAVVNLPATHLSQLDNGLRVASEDSGNPISTVGVWVDAGSRHETDSTNGVANFFRRMALKGTEKLGSPLAVQEAVRGIGGQLGTYTGREVSAFYIKCLTDQVPSAVQILADILQNSKFEEGAVEQERAAILREVQESEADQSAMVLDHLHAIAFQGTALANTVQGTTDNIKSVQRRNLLDYQSSTLVAPRLVLVGAGGVQQAALEGLAKQHFGALKNYGGSAVEDLPPYCRYTGSSVSVRDDELPVANMGLALQGCSFASPDALALRLASTMIGSWDRTSGGCLNSSRELARACFDGDLAQSFKPVNITYSDTGLWGIQFASDKMRISDMEFHIHREVMALCETISDFDVERAKNALKTELVMQLEDDTFASCEDIARSVIYAGRREPLADLVSRINALNSEVVRDVCARYLYDRDPAYVGIGPVEQMNDYINLRALFYWLRV